MAAITATTGLVSNIDYQSLITQLVGLKQQPIDALNTEKKTLQSTNTAYSNLGSKLQDIITAADSLRNSPSFGTFNASVSSETSLSATAGSTAAYGAHEVVVNTLAKSHKIAADGVSADTATIASGAGSFSFQVGGGAVQTVSVDATTTLAGLRDSINALKAGVTASIVNDGSGANPYRLILASDATGSANTVNITQNDTSLAFNTTIQAAQDATLKVDGLDITRQSNSISDVITGVTLDLKSADPAKPVTVTVSRDTKSVQDKVKKLVDSYNSVMTYIKGNNTYDSATKTGGAFFGDSVARSVMDDLRRVFTSSVAGLPGTMNALRSVGVSIDKEGVMSLDSTKLANALSSDFQGVVNLFTKGASVDGMAQKIYDTASNINSASDGRIKGRQDGIQKSIKRLTDTITTKQNELAQYEDQLRTRFTGLETMLASLKQQGAAVTNYFGGA